MPGAGFQPAGFSPAGFSPNPAPPANPPPVFNVPNATTSLAASGRLIDPGSRQYVFDAQGRIAGQSTIPQLVYLAYATVKGSSILASLGQDFTSLETIGEDYVAVITPLVTAPVQDLIDAKQLAIRNISITKMGKNGVSIVMLWTDLTTGLEGQTTL